MHRRSFVKGSFLSLASVSACCPKSESFTSVKKKFRLKLAMAVPKTLPIWGDEVIAFAKRIKLMTNGFLDIKVYGAGELVPALGCFDAVRSGAIDMAHSAPYYWLGKAPEASFFCTVPFGLDANGLLAWIKYGGGQELWDETYHHLGIKALPAGSTGMQMGGWFNKEIKTIDDFKGLKMRIPGLGARVLSNLGAKTVLIPGGEIYTSLATGVIDATEWVGPYHDYLMGFYKAAKYYYFPGWHEPGAVLELIINKKKWDSLPSEFQQIIISATAELNMNIHLKWLVKDSEYLNIIKSEKKVIIKTFPKEVLKKLHEISSEVKSSFAKRSQLAQRIYDSYQVFEKLYREQQKITIKPYSNLF